MKNLIIDFSPFAKPKGISSYNNSLIFTGYPLGEDFYSFQADDGETYFKDIPPELDSDDPEKTTNI